MPADSAPGTFGSYDWTDPGKPDEGAVPDNPGEMISIWYASDRLRNIVFGSSKSRRLSRGTRYNSSFVRLQSNGSFFASFTP